jgi:hypothetical protein
MGNLTWDLRMMGDDERDFIQQESIDEIDAYFNTITNELYDISELEHRKKRILESLRDKKYKFTKTKRGYHKLVKKARESIKIDLIVGDKIIITPNDDGVKSRFRGYLGYIFSDIEIIELTDKKITLKYDSGGGDDMPFMEDGFINTISLNKFKQIYIGLHDDVQIKTLLRNQTINEILK